MKKEILAVHKRKLEEFLRKLDLWEPLQRGDLICAVCGTTISIDNIGFIIPSGEDILLCCANTECIYKLKVLKKGELEDES